MTMVDVLREELEKRGYRYQIDFTAEELRELAIEYVDTVFIVGDSKTAIKKVVENWERRRTIR